MVTWFESSVYDSSHCGHLCTRHSSCLCMTRSPVIIVFWSLARYHVNLPCSYVMLLDSFVILV